MIAAGDESPPGQADPDPASPSPGTSAGGPAGAAAAGLWSFDVFDTTITRIVARPTDLFLLVAADPRFAALGLPPSLSGDFRAARVEAERRARELSRAADLGLDDIHRTLASLHALSAEQRDALRDLEIATEASASRPIGWTLRAIERIRERGGRILFVSDMYLPPEVITGLLERAGAWRRGDRLYVSSEIGRTKGSGLLFRELVRAELCTFGHLTHYGDHLVGDYLAPKRLGIGILEPQLVGSDRRSRWRWRGSRLRSRLGRALPALASWIPRRPAGPARRAMAHGDDLTRYEAEMLRSKAGPERERLLAAGIARAVRLSRHLEVDPARCLWETGADLIGPLFYLYVRWLLEAAERQGLRRLYFLARDGDVLQRIAAIVQRDHGLGPELRYLRGSRQAWLFPLLAFHPREEWQWLTAPDIAGFLSIERVEQRARLDPAVLDARLSAVGLAAADRPRRLSRAESERLRELVETEPVRSEVARRARVDLELALDHFRQEGLLSGEPSGVVDLGWNARSQWALSSMLGHAGGRSKLTGYYLGLSARKRSYGDDEQHAFLFDWSRRIERHAVRHDLVYEVFAASEQGRTTGYRREGGRVEPVLGPDGADELRDWGLPAQREAILAYAEEASRANLRLDPAAARGLLDRPLALFLGSPSAREAAAYGAFRYGSDVAEGDRRELAPVLDERQAWMSALLGKRPPGFWPAASFVRSGMRWRGRLLDAVKVNGRPLQVAVRHWLRHLVVRTTR